MNDKNPLTLRLADGKEQTCRDGYEMWVWFMSRRGIRVDSGREDSANGPVPRRRRRPQTQKTTVRVHRFISGNPVPPAIPCRRAPCLFDS